MSNTLHKKSTILDFSTFKYLRDRLLAAEAGREISGLVPANLGSAYTSHYFWLGLESMSERGETPPPPDESARDLPTIEEARHSYRAELAAF